MPVSAKRVVVGTNPTVLATPATSRSSGVVVTHEGSTTVYIGGGDVTVAQGFPLPPGASVNLELDVDDTLSAIVSAGTVEVSVLRVS